MGNYYMSCIRTSIKFNTKQNESRIAARLTTQFCKRSTTSEETKKIGYNYAEEMQKKDYICTSADEFGHLLTENIRLAERKQTF